MFLLIYSNTFAQIDSSKSKENPTPPKELLSDEVNSQLPDWLKIGAEYRIRWEGRSGLVGKPGNDDSYLLSRARLDFTFKPDKHWTVFLQGHDTRTLGADIKPIPLNFRDNFDLRQAYIEWKQEEKTGFFVKVGRQELNYGNQRLIGSLNWANTGRSFDAAKIGYKQPNYNIEVFASSVVVIDNNHFDEHKAGTNLYGAYASFPNLHSKAQLSTYVYWKTDPLVRSENGINSDADTITIGANLTGKFYPKLDYSLEGMLQRGSFSTDKIRAHAIYSKLGYSFSDKSTLPKLLLEYTHASGDTNPTDGIRGTFDQLYPSGHDIYGLLDQISLKNQHTVKAGSSWTPHNRLKFDFYYHSFWLAHRKDGVYNAGGALLARIPTGAKHNHIASEIDFQVSCNLRHGFTLAGGVGHWIPGKFWQEATPGAHQSFAYTSMTYRF